MKVFTIIDSLGGGGIETTLLRCIPRLRDRGVHVVLGVHSEEGGLRDAFKTEGCAVHVIPKTPNIAACALRVKNLIAEVNPDVVHSRLGYSGGGGMLGAWLSGVPRILSLHSTQPGVDGWKSDPLRRVLRRMWLAGNRGAIRLSNPIVIGHSIANLNAFDSDWQRKGKRYLHVPNGIMTHDEFTRAERDAAKLRIGVEQTRPVLLHIGNMREAKNHVGLVRLFAKVLAHRPEALLVVVGDGVKRALVEEEVHRLGIANNVQLRGFQLDTARFYQAADVFVFPSLFEGFGNVLVEAQLHRVPVVASDIPPHREAVAAVQHDYLFPVSELDAGAEQVLRCLNSSAEERRKIAEESFEYVRTSFTIDNMVDGLVRAYRDVVVAHQCSDRSGSPRI